MGLTARADNSVTYLDQDGNVQQCDNYIEVTSNTNWRNGGWYVVKNTTSISNTIYFDGGDVNLILCDGATLTLENGSSRVTSETHNTKVTIYAHSTGANMGKLIANSSNSAFCTYGLLTINGGDITSTGYRGISASGGCVINGGIVNCTGTGGQGIEVNNQNSLEINGGKVIATGKSYGIYATNVIIKDGR